MNNFKKNIILSSVDKQNNNIKGVFTIEKNNNACFGILRIYNLKNLKENYCLGVLVNGVPLQKTVLNSQVVFCKVELPCSIELTSKVAVVVVENEKTNFTPVVFGSTGNEVWHNGYNFFPTEDINSQIENEIKKQLPEIEEVKNPITQTEISLNSLNTISKSSLENATNSCKCENCVYKQNFYNQEFSVINHSQENIINPCKQEGVTTCENFSNIENHKETVEKNFYEIISPKLNELFELNPPCEQLTMLVPNSKWVTIVVSETEKYYIGIIYENSQVKYIAYAVDGVYSLTPPSQLEESAQWLPANSLFPEQEGFWLMFQNAETGE